MIHVDNVSKRYGATLALDRLTLAVPDGAVFGLVGPNGSGKSTFLKLLMGFLFPDAGRIDLGGIDRTRIGYTPDRAFLPSRLHVAEFLELSGGLSGLRGAARREAAAARLRQVGLDQVADKGIGSLSKGMLQRLSLAAALLRDPPLLLLDEPMSGLDPGQQAAVREIIRGLNREGRTVLLSTHRLSEVSDLCSHIGILNRGRLVQAGPLAGVLYPRARVEIVVDRLPPDLRTFLIAHYPGLQADDDRIMLEGPALACKKEILQALLDAGCDIRQLSQQQATLEEVYLEAVR